MIGKYAKLVEGKTAFELEDGTNLVSNDPMEAQDDDIPFA